ncbi:MAG TPA: ABC transporter permease [Vicinamibacterales bacterium]|nr:ABC transporter permease [Vicinamibacterales bacterium]
MSLVGYSTQEAGASLWRRRRTSLLSLLTIASALFVLGGFLLVNVNVQRWIAAWTDAAELSVYLADEATAEERAAIEALLAAEPIVASREYVSHEEALRRFRRLFPELAAAAEQLGDRPLPASYEVRLSAPPPSDEAVQQLIAALEESRGVSDVRYDRAWIDRLVSFVEAGRVAGVVLAGILMVAAALTVASVIRLALHARQQEIEIMHLVGAPLGYIRGPFVVEGIIQGGLGALLALVGLLAAYLAVRPSVGAWLSGMAAPDPAVTFLPWTTVVGLLLGGMAVGCAGGVIAARSAA